MALLPAEQEQQVWLVNCLNASMDAAPEIRKQAELALSEAALHQGYGVALAQVISNTSCPMGLRQLAAVLLKQYVNQHWSDDEKDSVPPVVSPQDKARIRVLLLPALGDPQGKIRTSVGMAISRIAVTDWPEEWPELMRYILECINDRGNIDRVRGGLRCLALFSDELDDKQIPILVPVLFPSLYTIVSTPSTYDASMRKAALTTLHSCLATLGLMMNASELAQTRALVSPMLKAWMEQFAAILSPPVQTENPEDWGLKLEVLRCVLEIVQNMSALAFDEFPVIAGPLWQTVASGLQAYQVAVIHGDQEVFAGLACSDGGDQSLETLMIQLLEVIVTLVVTRRYNEVIRPNFPDLVYYTIGFMQMTEEQVANWSDDPNHYIADEEDSICNCRMSAASLLEVIEDRTSILEAVRKRIEEAEIAKSNGQPEWWKLREAAIFALGSAEERLKDYPGTCEFVNNVLQADIARGSTEYPWLYGRALWGAAKFCKFLSETNRKEFVTAAVKGLSDDRAPIVIGSCRVLAFHARTHACSFYGHSVEAILSTLGHLLQKVSEEVLNLILEVVCAVLRASQCPAADSMMSPTVLNIWARHVCDPVIGIQALETLQSIKEIPACVGPFKDRVLPFLAGILAQPHNQPAGLVAGALDLLAMLITGAPMEVVRDAYKATFTSVINIMMQSDDQSELQNATMTLSKFVGKGENLLTWSSDPNLVMKMLLGAAARIIDPSQDSSSSFFVGRYIVELIQHLSEHMAPHLRGLVEALIHRFDSVSLKASLILVFARLVHMSAPNYNQFIDLLISIPSKKHDNALVSLMSEWTQCQGDVCGDYQTKVSTTALACLLATGHPYLSQIRVPGRLVQSVSGIMTRSRKKVQPDHYTTVTVPEKIFSIFGDMLAEAYEESDDVDDSWEVVSESDPLGNAVFQPAELYAQYLQDDDEDSLDDGDSDHDDDPLASIDLTEYLEHFMKTFVPQAPPSFLKALSDREKSAVEAALRK